MSHIPQGGVFPAAHEGKGERGVHLAGREDHLTGILQAIHRLLFSWNHRAHRD